MKRVSSFVRLGLASIAMAFPGLAATAPSISGIEGELSHGAQMTISGSQFGVKSPAQPYLWVPFEGSADPSPLGLVDSWQVSRMAYSPDEGPGGRGALKAIDSSGNWTARVTASGFNWNDPGQKMYLYRKSKRNFDIWNNPPGINTDDGPTINYKNWRLWSAGVTAPYAHIGISNGIVNPGPAASQSLYPFTNGRAAAGNVGDWHTNEISIRSNTNAEGNGDGSFQFVTDGTVYAEVPYNAWNGIRYWKMWDAERPPSMVVNFVVHEVKANATFPDDWRAWAADVYLDTTWARVMLGDAPNFEDAKHREIQIPMSWSHSSVTITVNTGTFPAGATQYLFVIDANGNASRGYAIGAIVPRPPDEVRIE